MNDIVTIKNLSHQYSKDWAVKNINLNINQNGVLGLLGSNGAGKSTIMNVMCGVLNQTEGDILIDGINIRTNPVEAKKKIGFLPQKAPLYLDNNIDEYLTYCASLRDMKPSQIPDAVENVKTKCGLNHFSKRLIKNLSGGYKQRTGIAGTIIHDPKVVVLDEPTVGLDPVQIVEVRKIIQDISKDRCVIFSTHMMGEVQALCDEIKMINAGQLVFSGSVNKFNDYIKPNSFLLSLKNPPHLDEIEKIEGVVGTKKINDNNIRVEFSSSQEITERVVEASIKNNWKLREISIERSSLEDVFSKITKDLNQESSELSI